MLDIRFIRENLDLVRTALQNRNSRFDLDAVVKLDDERKKILVEVEALHAQQNKASEEIGALIKAKKDPKPVIVSMKDISNRATELEKALSVKEDELNKLLLSIPNVPQPSVPVGTPD
ncbi:MAG: serine--tRNA ligase, partial [Candidatus Omnitrophota bacterium]